MALMAQRAGVAAWTATASAIILQVLAIGTGAAVAALTGWSSLESAYPGAERRTLVLLLVARWPSECCCGPLGTQAAAARRA